MPEPSSTTDRASFLGFLPFLLLPALVLAYQWPALGLFFEGDDWNLLGPGAAARFLKDPFAAVSSTHGFNYQPLTLTLYGILSLLFRDHPLWYHGLSLVLFGLVLAVFTRFLERLELPLLSRTTAVVVFGFSALQTQVLLWPSALSYILLSLFLFLSLLSWDRYLREPRRSRLYLASAFCLAAFLTHSLSMVLPAVLALYYLLQARGRGGGRGTVWMFLSALVLLLLACQTLPLYVLSGKAAFSRLDLGPGALEKLSDSFFIGLLPSITGMSGTALSVLCPLALVPLLILWLVKRTAWRELLFGLSLSLLFWIPTVTYDYTLTGSIIMAFRYYFFPNLGFSLALAALFSAVGEVAHRVRRILLTSLLIVFLALFLANSSLLKNAYTRLTASQHSFMSTVVAKYQRELARIRQDGDLASCPKIAVIDVPLRESPPPGLQSVGSLYFATHANFLKFFAWDLGGLELEFISPQEGSARPPSVCLLKAVNGELFRMKGGL